MRQTLIASRSCPITDSKEVTVVADKDRDGNFLRNVISHQSGLVYVDSIPLDDVSEFYKKRYRQEYKSALYPKKQHIYRKGKMALQHYKILQNYLEENHTVLDIGSSSGELLYLLKVKNIPALGIEPNECYAQYSQEELSVDVEMGMLSEINISTTFNLITMFHVFEHLENPLQCVHQISSLLADNGYVFIEVPNIVHDGTKFQNKWHKGHLYGYTEKTLNAIMAKVGFAPIFCQPVGDGGNVFGIFRKREGELNSLIDLQGHCDENLIKLRKNKINYYLKPQTYLKPFARFGRNLDEKVNTFNSSSPKEILDDLYRNEN